MGCLRTGFLHVNCVGELLEDSDMCWELLTEVKGPVSNSSLGSDGARNCRP